MRRSSVLTALAAVLALGGAASAQTAVPFETVAQGAHGAFGAPARHVIRSPQELRDTGVDRLLPAGTAIDFTQDMLVAVLMGTCNTGGYGVTVSGITREPMMVILPVPGPPPSFRLVVEVLERRPAPGSIVTMALTSPFHVVKLRRSADRVDFEAAPPPFDALQVNVRNQVRARDVTVGRDRAVRLVTRSGGGATPRTFDGRATEAEVAALRDALAAARLDQIPTNLAPASAPLGAERFTIDVRGGPSPRTIEGVKGFEGQYAQRLGHVFDAAEAIAARVERDASRAFQSLSYSRTRNPGQRSAGLTLAPSGEATVLRSSPVAKYAPVTGTATAAELDAVDAALRAARLSTIPSNLPVPTYIMAGDTFRLEVASAQPANRNTIEGDPEVLGAFEARLGPVLAALEAIVERLAPSGPTTSEASGVVRTGGGEVYLDQSKSMSFRVTDAGIAATLRRFVGRRARVEGAVTRTGPFSSDVAATSIVSPVKSGDLPLLVRPNGEAVVGGAVVDLFGPAARATRVLAAGGGAQVDGWLFSDAAGASTELYVEALNGVVRQNSILTRRNGSFAGYVPAGTRVKITGLAQGDQRVAVKVNNRTGYLSTRRVDVGAPIPLTTPTPTTGLSGSVPGQ